jgi:uncharacterized protein (TIGR04551 family)
MRRPATASSVLAAVALSAAIARAEAPPPESDAGVTPLRWVTFDLDGYFRLRNDLFYRPDLGARVGGIGTPLEERSRNLGKTDADHVLAASNLRLRLAPSLSIGDRLDIHLTLDVLDNVVLGSTTDFNPERADVPLAALAEGQAGIEDGIAVKALWLDWDILHGLTFSAGRMFDHFGLGMVANGGHGLDSDYGDSVDRVGLNIRAFGFTSFWFFDAPSEGATSRTPVDGVGQSVDLGSVDDAIRWGFTIGMQPFGLAEQDTRTKDLRAGKPVVEWVFRNAFSTQEFESREETDEQECDAAAEGSQYDCVRLIPRNASLWTPDLWVKLDWHPRHDVKVRIEAELAGMIGDIERVQTIGDPSSAKEFLAMGGVLQTEVLHGPFRYALEFGGASGDDVAFGPYGQGFASPDDAAYFQDDRLANNDEVTRFLFNRDYRVDLLMYREIVGTVTNSIYLKPTFGWTPIDTDAMRVGGSLSLIYGHAILADSTYGNDNPLGVETDLNLFYEQPGQLRVDLDAGLLVPLDGLDSAGLGLASKTAFTLQLRFGLLF